MVAFDDRLTDGETHSFGREHWLKNATEIGYTNSTPGIRDREKVMLLKPSTQWHSSPDSKSLAATGPHFQ